jgi:selenocysteine-specific elongation factor
VRLLGSEEIKPGESGWLQLELLQPVVVVRSDRYILRLPSPGETIGGGEVVDPHPKERHKRFATVALEGLEALRGGSAEDVILQAGQALGISSLKDILSRSRLSEESARTAIQTLVQSGELRILEAGNPNGDLTMLAVIKPVWEETTRRTLRELEQYHHANPLRLGMSKEELKSRLKLPQRVFQALLQGCVNEKMIEENGPLVRMKGFVLTLTPVQQRQVDDFLARCDRQPFMPPTIKEAQAELGEDLAAALVELQYMEPISEEIIFRPHGLQRVAEEVTVYLKTHSSITVAEFRDLIHTSRKYAVPLMEYLDAQGVTVREGDLRRLKGS